ncbi:MAG: hypothetical protein LBK83_06730 [Treponema sp.]|jgi:hypothetical protein|nr:hypothetical protein [Treponema sp.]
MIKKKHAGWLPLTLLLMGTVMLFACPSPLGPEPKPPALENPGVENPGGEIPGGENPGVENPGGENPGGDDPGEDDPGEDDPGEDDPGEDDPGEENLPGGSFLYGTNTVVVSVDPDTNSATVSIAAYVPMEALYVPEEGASYGMLSSWAFAIPADILSDLAGLSVSVSIENDGSDSSRPFGDGTLSLANVHEIYKALNAAAPASIFIDSATLTPLYKGSDWIRHGYKHNGYSGVEYFFTIYESYPNETTLMRGIKVRKEGGRYVVEYDRNLVVEDIVYIVYDDYHVHTVHGPGLYKKAGSSAVPLPATGDWADVVIGGYDWSEADGRFGRGQADESIAYLAHLAEAGLKYTGGSTPSPTHNMYMSSTDLNLFANGLYDFLKLHKDNNLMDRLDNADYYYTLQLPFASKLDGQVYESLATPRRLPDGHHNPAFQGNVPVYMVNLIRGKIGATTEFSNVNITGDGNDLTDKDDLNLANVSLVGDYRTGGVIGLTGKFYGNLDIEGDFPPFVTNNTYSPSGYLTAWTASDNTGMNNFAVFHAKTTDTNMLKRMGADNSLYMYLMTLQAIVFESRNSINNLGKNSIYSLDQIFPHAYKVVRDPGDEFLKFTGNDTSDGFATSYASDTSKPVPSLDPEAWRIAGNSKTNPATTTWGALDSSKKWSSGAFNLIEE